MTGYVLGIDGGGTKTAVCVCDLEGNTMSEFKTGAININGESRENVLRNLMIIFSEAGIQYGGLEECRSVCIGAAGISNKEAKNFLERTVRDTGYNGPLLITGDHETALYGALGIPEGIILVAGTGSICYGKNHSGKEHRTGGFGYLIDDEGSGYAIGRDILAAVVRSYDGRGEPTVLTQMIYEQLNISSIGEIIEFLYNKNTNKRDIAALAPNLTNACTKGDRVALGIAEKCSDELLKLVCPLAELLKLQSCSLALAGSVLMKDKYIRSGLIAGVNSRYPEIKCIMPQNDAAHGAAYMAIESIS